MGLRALLKVPTAVPHQGSNQSSSLTTTLQADPFKKKINRRKRKKEGNMKENKYI